MRIGPADLLLAAGPIPLPGAVSVMVQAISQLDADGNFGPDNPEWVGGGYQLFPAGTNSVSVGTGSVGANTTSGNVGATTSGTPATTTTTPAAVKKPWFGFADPALKKVGDAIGVDLMPYREGIWLLVFILALRKL